MKRGANFRSAARSLDQLWMAEYTNDYSDGISKLKKISLTVASTRIDSEGVAGKPSVVRGTDGPPAEGRPVVRALEDVLRPYKSESSQGIGSSRLKRKVLNRVKSSRLETLFEVQRREHEAAKLLQGFWRRSRVLLPWRRALRCVLAATRIQKLVRGFVTRKYVGRWHRLRAGQAVGWQARVRRLLSNKKLRQETLRELRRAALMMQALFRGYVCRQRLRTRRRAQACTVIQRVWRGAVSRCVFDKLWLDRLVVPIQKMARKVLAIQRTSYLRKELNSAAGVIQRRYRQWLAKRAVGDRFFEREVGYRQDSMDRMATAVRWTEEELVKLAKRLNKGKLVSKVEALVDALYSTYDAINDLQSDMTHLERQAQTLSPRSIQRGWAHDYKKNLVDLRKRITEEKLDCVFSKALEMTKLDVVLEGKVKDIEAVVGLRNRLNKWREEEEAGLHALVFERRAAAKEKARVRATADEKRKWRVLHYTLSGKPDKLRPPGGKWKREAMAGQEKATYSAGTGVDLLAFVRPKVEGCVVGSTESVDRTVAQYGLQVYLDQVTQYEKLLNPISSILGGYIDGTKEKDLGLGCEGEAFADALVDIGAITSRKSPTTKPKKLALSPLDSLRIAQVDALSYRSQESDDVLEAGGASPVRFRRMKKGLSTASVLSDLTASVHDDASYDRPRVAPRTFSTPSMYSGVASSAPQTVYTRTTSVTSASNGRDSNDRALASGKSKANAKPVPAPVPWEMLDKLEAERKKFEEARDRTKSTFRFTKF